MQRLAYFSARIGVLVVLLTLGGCQALVDWIEEEEVYEGTFAWGFEVSAFSPCESRRSGEQWWVVSRRGETDAYNELLEQYREVTDETFYVPVFVRVKGEPGERGTYGHLGAYERELALSSVIELRALADSDCPGGNAMVGPAPR